MKRFLFIILFFLSINAKSQTVVKDQIIGSWKVEKAKATSDNENVKNLSVAFVNSVFTFKSNQYFLFTSNEKNQLIESMIQLLDNKKWIFDKQYDMLKIGTDKDRYHTLRMIVKIENNKAFFRLNETELDLELVKI